MHQCVRWPNRRAAMHGIFQMRSKRKVKRFHARSELSIRPLVDKETQEQQNRPSALGP